MSEDEYLGGLPGRESIADRLKKARAERYGMSEERMAEIRKYLDNLKTREALYALEYLESLLGVETPTPMNPTTSNPMPNPGGDIKSALNEAAKRLGVDLSQTALPGQQIPQGLGMGDVFFLHLLGWIDNLTKNPETVKKVGKTIRGLLGGGDGGL
ncbi:MAG: hypothetical protein ACE5Z5_08055 [Candidatus Bathyarchaeia archaeon]